MCFAVIVGAILLAIFFFKIHKNYVILALSRRVKTIDGTDVNAIAPVIPGSTIFGNNFDMVSLNSEECYTYMRKNAAKFGKSYIQYLLGSPIYNIIKAEDAELIFNDSKLITKGMVYKFLMPFIRTGLLTSTGSKWHSRRKMLSPAFHFNILEQFLEIFKEESNKFVNSLKKSDGETISLTELIPRITLNAICETALGVKLDNMKEGDMYRKYIGDIERALVKRISVPLYMSDFLWEHMGNGKEFNPSYDGVHEFSSNIIEKRRAVFEISEREKKDSPEVNLDDDIFMSSKKQRYAMLDTLLMAEKEGIIDHQGICEEVDTFIFEGFDTTSMGLIYGIMNLSLYPEMQQRCFEEVEAFIDDDLTQLTIPQVNKLQYLDRFVKETLRMYPSVPIISREAAEVVTLPNKIILPKGSEILIHIYDILRDPKHFENPNVFDPDRFLADNSKGRHPFAFVPFSAGSRNCIGQKFANLEMKTVLVYFLKNFEAFQVGNPDDLKFNMGFLLRVTQEIQVRIAKRK